jgi:hypothetical protein
MIWYRARGIPYTVYVKDDKISWLLIGCGIFLGKVTYPIIAARNRQKQVFLNISGILSCPNLHMVGSVGLK